MTSLNSLNPQQRLAASTIEGPVLILAGAGSGKTRTITYRIAHMLEDKKILGSQILAVSFTNKAAKEMRERVHKLIHHPEKKNLTLCTYHSLGIKILRENIHLLGYSKNFTIYDTSDQMSLIREALKFYKGGKNFDRSVISSKISHLKNQGILPHQFSNSKFFDFENEYDVITEFVYKYYQEKLKFYSAIDFDDILYLTVQLLETHPELAQNYSKRFLYLMIDEYQDTNQLQFRLIKALTCEHQNICVVGDDDQSIYAFRGADISNILSFEKLFKGTKVIKLEENYRSTKSILDLANTVIKENTKRKDKTMRTMAGAGEIPQLWMTKNSEHEAYCIAEEILKLQLANIPLTEICLLYRSNTQIPPLEDQMRLSQIPYTILGGQKFYEKKEVKDLIAYLSVILNSKDEVSLRRILNIPNRGIGQVTLDKHLAMARDFHLSLFKTLEKSENEKIKNFHNLILNFQKIFKENKLSNAIEKLIDEINYYQFIEKSYDQNHLIQRKKNDVALFILSAQRFEQRFQSKNILLDFMEKLLLTDSQDKEEESKNEVTLMTLHSSKGLEFDYVFLVGMEEELLPHKRTIEGNEDIQEERRLAYVGITRARKQLYMTYCKERKMYNKDVPRFASRFVIELKDCYKHIDKTSFGDLTEEEVKAYKKDFFSGLADTLKS